ncbi:galectin-4 isoform X2 [Stomoxys calcitrans]|uniref:Galectin n=1 Tax=Stomoxys calcitrans TaxID=35570 RepID=A0A1I8PAY0_STOCA|nr:galectin-4 isoform X2 [Stomoxys calcitrans]
MEVIEDSTNEDISADLLYGNQIEMIEEGLTFFIRGRTLANGKSFLVDFCLDNATKDIALRVSTSLTHNYIGRNTRIKCYWGTEETTAAIPIALEPNTRFLLQILFTLDEILIALDGFHVAKYQHRLPYSSIRAIEIRGDVQDLHVDRRIVTDYPRRTARSKHFVQISNRHAETGIYDPADYDYLSDEQLQDEEDELGNERFLPLPYYASFPQGFFALGYRMGILGSVSPKAQSFKLSLQLGQQIWPQPTVALLLEFHFYTRPDGEPAEPIVARNSFVNDRWSGENKSEMSTGLRPGAEFHLVIVRGKLSFEIYLNNKPLTSYPYKVNPKYIDTLFVGGDMKLFNVEIEEGD